MTGQNTHSIDAKGRLFIPAKLREQLGETFHVTIGQDHCLWVFSDANWEEFIGKVKSLPYSQVKRLRVLFANAADCKPDTQGRILIPAKLREYASLDKDVTINGSIDRVEIWNTARWTEIENESLETGEWETAMEEMRL